MTSYEADFFLTNTKQATPALPAQVYDLTETDAVTGAATTLIWTTASQSSRRVNPYASNGTITAAPAAGAAASNFGWRLRRADADAASGEPRVVEAGNWTCVLTFTTGTYALLAASPTYTLTAILYRISSAGASTEIARASSAGKAIAATTEDFLAAVIALPTFTLAPGETIQIEWYLSGAATQNALSQVTNNTVTVRTATSYVQLASPLRTVATRSTSDSTPAMQDTTQRLSASVRRTTDLAQETTETGTRRTAFDRRTFEYVDPTNETPLPAATYRRASAPQVVEYIAETAIRLSVSYRRNNVFIDSLDVQAIRGTVNFRRSTNDISSMVDVATKQITYGRAVRYSATAGDTDPLVDPTRQIAGVIRNCDGTVYTGGALVILFRDDDIKVAQTFSAPDGTYAFPRNSFDTASYYVAAFITGAAPRQSVTERGLIPAALVPA